MIRKNSKITVLRNSGLYSVTSILQKAIGFFLMPLYTAYLTPREYGIIGIIGNLTGILSVVFTLALESAVSRFYFDFKDNEKELQEFWGTICVFITVNSIFVSVLVVIFKDYLISPLITGVAFYPYIMIGILTALTTPIYSVYQRILQTKQEGKAYAITSFLYYIFMVGGIIVLVVLLKLGVFGQIMSALITSALFSIYSVYKLLQRGLIKICFRTCHFLSGLRYSVPLIPHLLSGLISSFFSRVLLNNYVSTTDVGLFNIASQLMIIMETAQSSVNSAFIPWFYESMGKYAEKRTEIIRFADLIMRVFCIMNLLAALFIKEVIQVMTNPAYLGAWVVVPVLAVVYQIRGIYLFYSNALFYNKRATKYIFVATISGNLVSILFSYFFTQRLGLYTPALAFLVSFIITTTIVVAMSNSLEPINFRLDRMIGYVVMLSLGILGGLVFDIRNIMGNISFPNILYKLTFALLFSFILMRKDLPLISSVIKRVIHRKQVG